MLIKQTILLLLLSIPTLHGTRNVDPFFSKRTISTNQPQLAKPSSKPSSNNVSSQSSTIKPAKYRPHAKPKSQESSSTTLLAPAAAAVAWYNDTRLYYVGAGMIVASAAAYVWYKWYYQDSHSIQEPAIVLAPDDKELLFKACTNDNVQVVQEVLDRSPSLIEILNDEGITPLIAASAKGSCKVVNELLNRHAHIDAAVHNGTTALKVAAAYGHANVVKELAQRGASMEPNAETPFSALMVAVWHGQLEVVKALLEHGADIHARVSLSALDIAKGLMQSDITDREREVYGAIANELNKKNQDKFLL